MPFTNETKNSTTYTNEDQATGVIPLGQPLGLLLAITSASLIELETLYTLETKNAS